MAMRDTSPFSITVTLAKDALAFAAILSSLVIDYVVRKKSTRMSFFIVEQLPMLKRLKLEDTPAWLGEKIRDWINKRAVELTCTIRELQNLASSIEMEIPPCRWEPSLRQPLQAESDAAILHLYGLDREQSDWALDSFTVLRKYKERDHSEFGTKRLALSAYDAMAKASASGTAYKTTLSPPPADSSLCHPIPATEVSDA